MRDVGYKEDLIMNSNIFLCLICVVIHSIVGRYDRTSMRNFEYKKLRQSRGPLNTQGLKCHPQNNNV